MFSLRSWCAIIELAVVNAIWEVAGKNAQISLNTNVAIQICTTGKYCGLKPSRLNGTSGGTHYKSLESLASA